MEAQNRSMHSRELQLSELEAVSGGGFWKDVGHGAGVLARQTKEYLEEMATQAVEGIYNIGTTGSP